MAGLIQRFLKVLIEGADDKLVDAGKDDAQVIEQLIYDLLVGEDKPIDAVANDIRPLSQTRPTKKALREKLAKLDICK